MRRNKLLLLIGAVIIAVTTMAPAPAVAQGSDLQPGPATISRIGEIRSFTIKAEPDRDAESIVDVFEGQRVTVLEVVRTSPTASWAHLTYDAFEGWLPAGALVNAESESTGFELDPVLVEQNLEIGRRVVEELWGGEDTSNENFVDLYSDVLIFRHALGQTTSFISRADNFPNFYSDIHTPWPDLEVVIREITASEDTVMVHFTARGTFSNATQPGSFLGRDPVQPTNEEGIWDFVIIERIENGRIVEEWWFWNREVIEHALGADDAND